MADCAFCQQPLPEGAVRCPRCGTPAQQKVSREQRAATVMEPIHSTEPEPQDRRGGTIREPIPPEPDDSATQTATHESLGAVVFRPLFRAPMAILTLLDDGRRIRGEEIRLRADRTVIGRTTGEVLIPHDAGISGKHAEIVRKRENGHYRWSLRDLGSRNGTFVRVSRARLSHNQELLIGGTRYRFDAAPQGAPPAAGEESSDPARDETRPWQTVSEAELSKLIPSLVELTPQGEGQRFLLENPENVIGSRPHESDVVIPEDPFISPAHCRIRVSGRQRWTLENLNALNGVWLRIESIAVDKEGEFQLGEQRFTLKVL